MKKIKCTSCLTCRGLVTVRRIYKVIDEDKYHYEIITDNGGRGWITKDLFKVVADGTYMNVLAEEIHEEAVKHGWYDEPRTFGDIIALIHSEVTEAFVEYRDGHSVTEIYHSYDKPEKSEGVPVELADVIIRVLDFCAAEGIDIDTVIKEKMAFNKTRPYKHGGKKL